jgi:hypothetical protein
MESSGTSELEIRYYQSWSRSCWISSGWWHVKSMALLAGYDWTGRTTLVGAVRPCGLSGAPV